jgi:hypothetical protein
MKAIRLNEHEYSVIKLSDEQITDILSLLMEKTKEGKLKWGYCYDEFIDNSVAGSHYECTIKGNKISLYYSCIIINGYKYKFNPLNIEVAKDVCYYIEPIKEKPFKYDSFMKQLNNL